MICKNCSTEFEGIVCPECGAPAEGVEQVTEPTVEELGIDEPVRNSEVIDVPKKKKTGLIVAIIIIVLAVAAFCVASFTDLFFPKQAQFISVLSNMGSDVSADFDEFTDKNLEMKLSAKLNGESDVVTRKIPKEVVDLVNSLSLSAKTTANGKERMDLILSLIEGDKKLADILAFETKDAMYMKSDFSDVVIVAPLDKGETDVDLAEYIEFVKTELKAVLEKHEPVKGVYNGVFDLGMELKTLTVTLGEDEINETLNKIVPEGFKTFGMTKMFEKPEDGYGIKEISVSSFYTGAFSFARKSLGMSVTLKLDDGKEYEVIFYSNKENKAIYGYSLKTDYYEGSTIMTDNFEIKNGERKGVITSAHTGVWSKTNNATIEYTIKKNNFNFNYKITDEEHTAEVKFSAVRDDKVLNASAVLIADNEEFGGIYIDFSPCEPVSVEIDTDKAIDITKDELTTDEQERIMAIVNDLQTLIEENEGSVLLTMLGELFAEEEKPASTGAEIILGDMGIDHVSVPMKGSERGAFLTLHQDESITIYDLHEIGYEDGVVKELIETTYCHLTGYTEKEKQNFLAAMLDGLKDIDDLDFAEVTGERVGDYVVTTTRYKDLDVPANVKQMISMELISVEKPTDTVVNFDYLSLSYSYGGYLRIE